MSNERKQLYAAKYPFMPHTMAAIPWEHNRFIIEQSSYKERVEAIPKIQTLSVLLSLTHYLCVLKCETRLPFE